MESTSSINETSSMVCHLRDDGILYVKLKTIPKIDLEEIKRNISVQFEIAEHTKRPLLIDITNAGYVNKDARNYAKEVGPIKFNAQALITNSTRSKIISQFIIHHDKPTLPTKVFTSEEKAVGWLKDYL